MPVHNKFRATVTNELGIVTVETFDDEKCANSFVDKQKLKNKKVLNLLHENLPCRKKALQYMIYLLALLIRLVSERLSKVN